RVPPTLTSIFATGMVAPSGPYHLAKCSGSVHIRQTRSTGALRVRSITTASWVPLSSVIVFACLSLLLELLDVVVHSVEAGFPDGPVLLGPRRNRLEWCGVEGARSVLGALAPCDQPRPFEHLDVLRDGRQRHVEGLGEVVDVCFALREARQNRSPRRVGQRGEGLAESVLVDGQA